MKVIAFDVIGKLGHFRRPDTTATQMTYPFITPTAARGMVGAILGIDDFVTTDKIGLHLLRPVSTVAQQMSMLGKDSGPSFNRPTTIELLVNPGYRIYYAGEQYTETLLDFLKNDHAVYPTYLGTAYALTKPRLYRVYENARKLERPSGPLITSSVIPAEIVSELQFVPDTHLCRAGGFLRHYSGNRNFERSIDFIYERDGKPISFETAPELPEDIDVVDLGEEIVCLF